MLSSFDKLSRMLTQEKRLGYKNKAILGGLEKLAPNWASEAFEEVVNPQDRQVVEEIVDCLYRYPDIPDEDRPRYIHQLLVRLHKTIDQAASRQESPPPRPVQPEPVTAQEAEPVMTPEPAPPPVPELDLPQIGIDDLYQNDPDP